MILHSFNYLRIFKKQLRHVFFLFESIKIFLLFSSQHHEIRSSTVNTGVFNSSKYKFKINTSMFYKSTWVICKLICHFYKRNIIPVSNKVKFNIIPKWFLQLLICRIFKLLQWMMQNLHQPHMVFSLRDYPAYCGIS